MKKLLSALLASLMLLPAVACTKPNEDPPSGETTQTEQGTTDGTLPETESETEYVPNIAKKDYGGADFRMVSFNAPGAWFYAEEYLAGDSKGTILNNVLYEMNTTVEDHLGVEFDYKTIPGVTGNEVFVQTRKTIEAGDDVYQMVILPPYYCYNSFISQGYALNLYDFDELALDQAHWNKPVMDELSIKGKAYIGMGDICLYDINMFYCNKDMLADAHRSVPYDKVRDGTWTYDEFATLTTGLYEDANGNGKRDNQDIYGVATMWDANASAFMHAADIQILKTNDAGTFDIVMYDDRLVDLYDKMLKWSKDESTYLWRFTERNDSSRLIDFNDNTLYLIYDKIGTQYLKADFEVGILPMPKYDVLQEEYAHVNWGYNIIIPRSILFDDTNGTKHDMIGEVLELMGYYSRTMVFDTYFNEVLQLRVSEAPDDREMVNLIFDTVVFDAGIAYCDGNDALWNLVYLPTFTILDGQANIASYYERNEKNAVKGLDKLFASIQD